MISNVFLCFLLLGEWTIITSQLIKSTKKINLETDLVLFSCPELLKPSFKGKVTLTNSHVFQEKLNIEPPTDNYHIHIRRWHTKDSIIIECKNTSTGKDVLLQQLTITWENSMFDYKVTPIQLVTDYSVKECLTEAKNLLVYEMTDKYLPKLIELKNVNMYTAKSDGIYIFFSIPDIRESGLHMPCFITKLFGGEPIFEYKTKCLALSKDTTENVDICEYTSVDRSVIFDFALKVKDHSEVKFYENENFEVQRMMLTNKGIKPTINMKLKTNGHVNVYGTEILKFEYKVVLTREKTYNTSKTIFFINRIQNIHETKKINYITSYDIPSLLPFCKIRIGTYSILEKIIFEDGTKKLTINYTELKEKRIMDHFELLKGEVIYKKRNKKILELACFYKTIVSSFIYTNVFHFHNFPNFDRPVNRGKQIEYRKNLTYTTIYCCLVIILMILAIYVNMIWYIKGKRIKGRIKKYRRFKDGERTSESGTLPLNLEYRKKIIEMRRNVYKIKENKSDNEENKSFSRVSISGKEKRS